MRGPIPIVMVLAALLCVVPACGGGSSGSSGPQYSNATWAGSYVFVCLSGSQGSSEVSASFGTITADGAGSATGTVTENLNGTPGSPTSLSPSPYSVTADGTVTIEGLTGVITPDGEFVVLMEEDPVSSPTFCVFMRVEGAYTDASLSGNFYMGGLEAATATVQSLWTDTSNGPVGFDGSGTGSYPSVSRNVDGLVGPQGGGVSSYGVNADGTATFDATWFGAGEGGVSSDGLIAINGGATDFSAPFFQCFFKEGSGMSAASLAGTYAVVGLEADPSDSLNFTSYRGTMTADGAGSLAFPTVTQNNEGAISMTSSGSTAYTVSPTGHVSTANFEGAISADGRAGFLAGSTSPGSSPILLFLVRR